MSTSDVTGAEFARWLDGRNLFDRVNVPNMRRIDAALVAQFGDREFDYAAQQMLYGLIPKVMAHVELRGWPKRQAGR